MKKLAVGYALSASFCTFSKSIAQLKKLVEEGYDIIPIMSTNASTKDTRFGTAESFIAEVEKITNTMYDSRTCEIMEGCTECLHHE